ncbi:type II secretion system minor pseudopilin GspI [Sphingomonas sp. AOB5]|uniref:type II secretion system minor pseudopilin GspI n=1 Tax=Sphingomonas sp. AOB5 TaxID=3034017 RepID=UPI0023F774FC|nr:type II secretion system minor pseudopilin GspI [Sphingomonas sp. AOB5]MDF7777717.1 type II secretion system minor pseudopilin GspI [Sphingomonas sp. AOB5]
MSDLLRQSSPLPLPQRRLVPSCGTEVANPAFHHIEHGNWAPAFAGEGIESSRGGTANDSGFSLIEALVALAVLAIASVGLMRAVESHIDSTRGLERRATAMWIAENRLAELEFRAEISESQPVEMLGQQWRVAVTRTRTDDAEINKVRIQVFQGNDKAALATLDGFVDGRRG